MFAMAAGATILGAVALLVATLTTTNRLAVAADHVHIKPLTIALYLVSPFNEAFLVWLVGAHPVDYSAIALDGVLGHEDHFFLDCFCGCHYRNSFPIAPNAGC